MTAEELTRRLEDEGVVSLKAEEWAGVADAFVEIERHDTHVAGDLVIVRTPAGPAAVEAPRPHQRVIRRLADMDKVRRFVADRLATYERMWDGCGCKIDYLSKQ